MVSGSRSLDTRLRPRALVWVAGAYLLASVGAVVLLRWTQGFHTVHQGQPTWPAVVPLLFPLAPLLIARTRAAALYSFVHPALVFAAAIAFQTIGEVHSFMILSLAWLGVFPAVFLLERRLVGVAFLYGILVVAATLPHQVLLAFVWYSVHQEAVHVAKYLEDHARKNGAYPGDLGDYRSKDPWALRRIRYSREGRLWLSYHIGSRNTQHWYVFDEGKWSYYPD